MPRTAPRFLPACHRAIDSESNAAAEAGEKHEAHAQRRYDERQDKMEVFFLLLLLSSFFLSP